jgi:Amt family ammonium transporter
MRKAKERYSLQHAAAQMAILQSVTSILWRSIAAVAITELSVMLVLEVSGHPITFWISLLDTFVLSAIALPVLYAVILKPVAQLAAERAAAAAESHFQTIAHAVQDGIIIFDASRNIQFANEAAELMHGYPSDSLRGKPMEALIPSDIRELFRRSVDQFLSNGEGPVIGKGTTEQAGLRRDGQRFPVEISVSTLLSDADTRFVVVLRDIAERNRAQEELKRAEEKYRSIFEEAMAGTFQTTPEGKYLSVNPALARLYGFDSPEELMSSRTDIASQTYVDPGRREEFKRVMEEQGVVLGFEYEVYRKDGTKIWLLENARAIRDAGGAILYYTGTVVDVTERKRVENALVKSESKLRRILEALPVAVRIVEGERIVYANPTDAQLHGYASYQEEIGIPFTEHVVPEERNRVWEIIRRQEADEPAPKRYRILRRRKDGSEFQAECTVELIEYEGRKARLNVIEDLTDRERLGLFEKLLPVCCVCGKIRNDAGVEHGKGPWERLDHYVARHSDVQMSHTFCPECMKEYRRREGLG